MRPSRKPRLLVLPASNGRKAPFLRSSKVLELFCCALQNTEAGCDQAPGCLRDDTPYTRVKSTDPPSLAPTRRSNRLESPIINTPLGRGAALRHSRRPSHCSNVVRPRAGTVLVLALPPPALCVLSMEGETEWMEPSEASAIRFISRHTS